MRRQGEARSLPAKAQVFPLVDQLGEVLKNSDGGIGPSSPDEARKLTSRIRQRRSEVGCTRSGYLPMPADDANALFQVISQRYLKGSIILTTNKGIGSWGDIFDDTTVAAAMLDRLLHRSVVFNITGNSYRLRAHQARNKQLTTNPTT